MSLQNKNNQSLWVQPYKLIRPSVNRTLLIRERLLHLLDQCQAVPVGCVRAPAGFGKSTLVVSWLQERQMAHGWYTLDSNDNDANCFSRHLIFALHHASNGGCPQTLALIQQQEIGNLASLLSKATMEIAQSSQPFFMVFDDLQVIDNLYVLQVFKDWLRLLPPHIHVILCCQNEPPLSLTSFRVKGQIVEIGINQLGFTETETAEFLTRNLDFPVSQERVSALYQQTNGWPAAMQLLTRNAQSDSDLLAAGGRLGKSAYDIHEFIIQEVIGSQPERVQQLLNHLCVFEQFNLEICQTMMPDIDAVGLIHELELRQLFLQRVDGEQSWFRFQDVFRDCLLTLNLRERPDEFREMKKRAVLAFLQNGQILDSVHLALELSDSDSIEQVLQQAGLDLYRQGQFKTLSKLFKGIDIQRIRKEEHLTLLYAWVLLATYQEDQVLALFADLPETSPGLMAEYAIAQAQAAINVEDFDQARALAKQALQSLGDESVVSRTVAYSVLGQSALCGGQLTQALSLLKEAELQAFNHRLGQQRLWSMCLISDVHTANGDLKKALEVQQAAIDMAHDCCIEDVLHMEFLYRNRIHLLIEQGDLNQADRLMRKCEVVIEPLGSYGLLNSYIHRGLLALWRGQKDVAANLAFQVNYLLQSYDYHTDWLARALEFLLACRQLGILTFEPAMLWREPHLQAPADNHFYQHYQRIRAIDRYLAGEPQRAIADLKQLATHADRIGLTFQSLKNRIQLALWQANDDGAALWEQLLPQIRELKPLQSIWLSQVLSKADLKRDWPDWHVWVHSPEPSGDASGPQEQKLEALNERFADPMDLVTPKELQVLLLIGANLNNEEIAANMHIALSTVKSHIRRLYRKLNISRRAQAIDICQHL